MSDPKRSTGGRENGPALGTALVSALLIVIGIVLLVARLATGALEPFGTVSNVLMIVLGLVMGGPALQRERRNRNRDAAAAKPHAEPSAEDDAEPRVERNADLGAEAKPTEAPPEPSRDAPPA